MRYAAQLGTRFDEQAFDDVCCRSCVELQRLDLI